MRMDIDSNNLLLVNLMFFSFLVYYFRQISTKRNIKYPNHVCALAFTFILFYLFSYHLFYILMLPVMVK